MKKEVRRGLHVVLASTMIASPFVATPKAHASTDFYVEADDETAGEDTSYDFYFTPEDDLSEGDKILIDFPDEYDMDDVDIAKSAIDVDGDTPQKVTYSGHRVTITLDYDLSEGDEYSVHFDSVTNPDDEDDYTFQIKVGDSDWEDDDISIDEDDDDEDDDDDNDDEFSVDLDSYETGEDTGVELGPIDLEDDLEEGSYIYVTFPTDDMLPSDIDEGDVEINGEEPDSVSVVDDDEVKIKIPEDVDGDDELTITFSEDAGIQNPDDEDDNYNFEVEYDGTTYTSEDVEISDDGSSSSSSSSSSSTTGTVTLSTKAAGERSSYAIDLDFGNKDISYNSSIQLEFPSADMLPGYLEAEYVTINGKPMRSSVYPSGKTVTITTPSNFSSTNELRVIFSYYSYLQNPKTSGSYQIKATASGKTVTTKSFDITGTSVTVPTTPTTPTVPTTPTTPSTSVNNTTATIGLSKSTLNTATGINVGIKGLGLPLVKNSDFLEVSLPSGFRVPTAVNTAAISVNGSIPSFVTTRGQNLVIYPSQDIAANTAVNVVVGEASNIVTPAAASSYTVGVYSSKEKNALFTRVLPIGGAAPAATIPTNGARVKLNVASFTLNGKTYPLAAAPYTFNSNTLVPAQFFKEALSLTTVWSPTAASVTSGNTQIKFTVGSNIAKVNGVNVKLPVAVQVKNGMPMIPVRMVSDTLKYKLGWEAATSSIVVYR